MAQNKQQKWRKIFKLSINLQQLSGHPLGQTRKSFAKLGQADRSTGAEVEPKETK